MSSVRLRRYIFKQIRPVIILLIFFYAVSLSFHTTYQNNISNNISSLWSIHLADEYYYRLAHLIPCTNVTYDAESPPPKGTSIDSCNTSPTTNPFAVETTIRVQEWLHEHQNPSTGCAGKRFALIDKFASSGFGSTIHQLAWAVARAWADDRIAIYSSEKWMYGSCEKQNPDCFFIPLTNCSLTDANLTTTITINGNHGYFSPPILPPWPLFINRTLNWYHAQLIFFILRFNQQTLLRTQQIISESLSTSLLAYRPYIAVYVRRSDKVEVKEMKRAYSLEDYFRLFQKDARQAQIRNVYINSEDENVFKEFCQLNEREGNYFRLMRIRDQPRSITFATLSELSENARQSIVYHFLTDLFIQVHADMHAGALSSNWCRLVDEVRLATGKIIAFYTPEDWYTMYL